MKEIDFTMFLGSDKVSDYISFVKHQLQLLKRFKSYKFLLNERIINFDFSEIEVTEKQLEIFEFKIEKEENLFCFFYFEYEKLKTFSYEEKINASIDLFFDTIWKTALSSFQIFRLQNRFLDDYKEFYLLSNQESINQTPTQQNIDLCNSIKLKEIFIDQNLFNKIDFGKLKEYNVFYDQNSEGFKHNERRFSDITFLCIILENKKIIKLPTLKYINEIIFELTQETVSTTNFTNCRTKYLNPLKEFPSEFDKDVITNIESFVSEYK